MTRTCLQCLEDRAHSCYPVADDDECLKDSTLQAPRTRDKCRGKLYTAVICCAITIHDEQLQNFASHVASARQKGRLFRQVLCGMRDSALRGATKWLWQDGPIYARLRPV